jgi:hypothetical protein
MHANEYIAVMKPNEHWHLFWVNGRFPNGALVSSSSNRPSP